MQQFYTNTLLAGVEAPVAQPTVLGEEPDNRDWSREEWLAWYEGEFAGYAPNAPTVDDAGELEEREALFASGESVENVDRWCPGPIEVSQWQLAQDRSTLAHLQRSWRGLYREGPNGERVVRGAHPFSVDEGAAEWLQRARIEMRQLYREAKTDPERAAVRAREAALRARHNARCYARAFAVYHRLDPKDTCRFLDGWQRQNPIGWLGLEAAMRRLFEGCFEHYQDAIEDWNAYGEARLKGFGNSWMTGEWSQEEKDEWLARMPVAPEYPTQLVTSAKTIRRYSPKRETTRKVSAFEAASAKHRSKLQRDRERRAKVAAAMSRELPPLPVAKDVPDTWYAVVKEWERAEMVDLYVKQTVPESYPCDWKHGQLCDCRTCTPS